ncbi:MAG TPA: phosphate signaling complex protein PhoU [Spirochaetota bacterium]|nr:phosphate signaling complex protein PhoU [Spirochaetota bacterium]
MPTHLEQDLQAISAKIYQMADLAIESIRDSVDSLKNQDARLAENVIRRDSELDKLEIIIDEECIRLLVTRQPAAADLRLILTITKTNTDLERIGDLSTNIAKETLDSLGKPLLKPLVDIPRMGDLTITMIKMAFRAITEKNADLARECIAIDRQVDEINMQIYRELFSYMAENPATLSPSLGLIMVAKALERIGDHATNIAERAVYYIEGEDIRHQE